MVFHSTPLSNTVSETQRHFIDRKSRHFILHDRSDVRLRSRSSTGPSTVSDVTSRQRLWSASRRLLVIPRYTGWVLSDWRAFSVADPSAWNSLDYRYLTVFVIRILAKAAASNVCLRRTCFQHTEAYSYLVSEQNPAGKTSLFHGCSNILQRCSSFCKFWSSSTTCTYVSFAGSCWS